MAHRILHLSDTHVTASGFDQDGVNALASPDRILRDCRRLDVIAVLCGHFHVQLYGQLGGAAIWVTPGVVTRLDLTAPGHLVRGVKGASATVVDLGGPFSPAFHVLHARDPEAGQQVYVADPTTWQTVDGEGQA